MFKQVTNNNNTDDIYNKNVDESSFFTSEGKVYIQNLTSYIINNYNKKKTSYLIEDYIDYDILANTEIKYGIENSFYNELELQIIKRNNVNSKQLFKILRNLRLKKNKNYFIFN